jgi:hypothetical protein
LDHFDVFMSKLNLKNIYYFDVFLNKKYFKKQHLLFLNMHLVFLKN